MIQQEIKLYPEPIAVVSTPSRSSYLSSTYTKEELEGAIALAETLGIKVGSKFKYKQSGVILTVVGYQTDPTRVYPIAGSPGVLVCTREGANYVSSYSSSELLNSNNIVELQA